MEKDFLPQQKYKNFSELKQAYEEKFYNKVTKS